jgi:hypothetical protein
MTSIDITEKRPCINFFKINKAYYFKHFFNDPDLFRELEPYYDKANYRFKMASAGARNKVMKLLLPAEAQVSGTLLLHQSDIMEQTQAHNS